MGGNNKKENIVFLTPREHFIAHHLLWKIHKTVKMHRAFWLMSTRATPDGSRYRVTSSVYEKAKETHKIESSKLHKGKIPWNKDKTGIYSKETIEKMSLARQGFIESAETKLKKSVAHIGIKKGPSPMKGRSMPFNDKWFIICPHCNKQGTSWNMKRYHFDMCKFKEKENLH